MYCNSLENHICQIYSENLVEDQFDFVCNCIVYTDYLD